MCVSLFPRAQPQDQASLRRGILLAWRRPEWRSPVPRRIFRVLAILSILLVAGFAAWRYFVPPGLLQVGSGYAAKIVCSNVFLANRDPDEVLSVDVQAPGNPLLRLMQVNVDHEARRVDAALLGMIAPSQAIYREGRGCVLLPYGASVETVGATEAAGQPDAMELADTAEPWPEGENVEAEESIEAVLSDASLAGPGMRAMLVVRAGRIVAERYGDGFSKDTPLLGWSMSKTVNAAIVGRLIMEGRVSLGDSNLFPEWSNDARAAITVANLMAMESGLAFNENYGTVADVTRMLFLEPDMARFVASLPLEADVGSRFNYSSGTSVLLSRVWMDRLAAGADAADYPRHALFAPLGMHSAIMETDAAGTSVGSSHIYATARDWARFGLLLAHDGVWRGERLLPEGFVAQMTMENVTPGGRYSQMQTWLPTAGAKLPEDAFILEGHDGQRIFVIPSMDLVVLRMGLTPRSMGYNATALASAVVARLEADD
jgi:CubicO group peptidase (beta-lactamase class C family)